MENYSGNYDSCDRHAPPVASQENIPEQRFPGGLKATCMIAIILGVSGMILAVSALVALAKMAFYVIVIFSVRGPRERAVLSGGDIAAEGR